MRMKNKAFFSKISAQNFGVVETPPGINAGG
jgi:hypothetical protein